MHLRPLVHAIIPGAASPSGIETKPLPLDEPPRSFSGAIAVCSRLWGPFRRLFIEGRAGEYTYMISTGDFQAEPLPNGEIRLTTSLHVALQEGITKLRIAMTRSANGRITGTEWGEDTGGQTASGLQNVMLQPTGGFLCRRTLSEGEVFQLDDAPAGNAEPHAGLRLSCRVTGRSTYKGRPVIVAACGATHAMNFAGWAGWLHAAGNIAIDIETGVVVLSATEGLIYDAATNRAPLGSIAINAWFSLQDD